jgi:hypothetical protein
MAAPSSDRRIEHPDDKSEIGDGELGHDSCDAVLRAFPDDLFMYFAKI